MSITVDTVNLRFNVTPDYKQQQLQRLQDDLRQSQKEAGNARKELDKYTQKVVNLQDSLGSLRARRAELARQKTLTTEESKEFDKLAKSIEKAEDELLQAKKAAGQTVEPDPDDPDTTTGGSTGGGTGDNTGDQLP